MNEARYQLRQSPVTRRTKQRGMILADATAASHIGARIHLDTPGKQAALRPCVRRITGHESGSDAVCDTPGMPRFGQAAIYRLESSTHAEKRANADVAQW